MLAQYVSYTDRFARELARIIRPNGNAFVTFGTDRISGFTYPVRWTFPRSVGQSALTAQADSKTIAEMRRIGDAEKTIQTSQIFAACASDAPALSRATIRR